MSEKAASGESPPAMNEKKIEDLPGTERHENAAMGELGRRTSARALNIIENPLMVSPGPTL